MNLPEFFLDEVEREAASTRRVLERVPEGRNDWKPHPKSMPLGYLAALCANMLGWIDFMVNQEEFDIEPPSGASTKPKIVDTVRELVEALDVSLEKARKALKGTTEDHLLKRWKFLVRGHVVSEDPRYLMIRDGVLNHLAHHRGQLTVYLRLNESAVPAIYGPSADEAY